MPSTSSIQSAGAVDIQELTLISGAGVHVSLVSYLSAFNLYEDVYAGGMYGNVVLTDSLGLINKMSIVGEEYLNVKIDTPGFNSPIWKTFKCCGISDREFVRDTTTERYVLHFVSPEVFLDHYMPVQRAFNGPVEDIVADLFNRYLSHPRNMNIADGNLVDSEDSTELSIFTECKTPVKFVSPTWSAMKCLSWLASKVTSTDTTLNAANFLFFESNKRFYWGSMEDMVRTQRDAQNIVGIYIYSPGNVKEEADYSTIMADSRLYKNPDLTRDFFSVHELNVMSNVDVLKNIQTGYLASVFHELDITSRKYNEIQYDHVVKYPYYQHTSNSAKGFFADDAVRVPYAHQIMGFKHVGLHDNTPNNLNEFANKVVPVRNSMLAEMNQIKLKISVYGRTDVEVGSMMYFVYPKSGPKNESDLSKGNQDEIYSGLYVITAIHHHITLSQHTMTWEIVKDSFGDVSSAGTTE